MVYCLDSLGLTYGWCELDRTTVLIKGNNWKWDEWQKPLKENPISSCIHMFLVIKTSLIMIKISLLISKLINSLYNKQISLVHLVGVCMWLLVMCLNSRILEFMTYFYMINSHFLGSYTGNNVMFYICTIFLIKANQW